MRPALIFAMSVATLFFPFTLLSQPLRQQIGEGWEMRQGRGYNWYPATVPGTVHTDLMAADIIEDPFMRLNERGVQWVDKEDWIYRTRFDVEPGLLAKDNIELVFEGLDTYADVTLNGEKILSADNMFRRWTAEVKELLRGKDNELEVYFHSPVKVTLPMWEATPWRDIIESGNDQSANGGLLNARVGVFARKAGYHFGWDWGPRLVTSGIWRPVTLRGWDDARVEDVFYRQTAVDSTRADVSVTVALDAGRDIPRAEIVVTNRTDGKQVARWRGALEKGRHEYALDFTVRRPRLWWTNGLGEPFLYDFDVEVRAGGELLDRRGDKLGLRSLRVVTEPDRWGESFYFELNGVPVFMKGANYIPCDNFLPRVTDEIYEKTIRDAAASNMNMLRVWGGGIYENDIFYELCDRYGILVWQDFMFSCALYPAEGELMENIREEAVQNVKRLRNHPCMALWCGNNECLDMWFHWGVKRRYDRTNPEWSEIQWRQFTDLYYNVLPAIVEQYHPGICYRKSSPYSDDRGMRSDSIGDYHDWDVWGQALEFDLFNRKRSRFFSEYGFQGFPSFQSIRRFAPEERDWAVTSEVMLSHQRAGTAGNQKIESMLRRDYGEPVDFEAFTYMSQLMQADAMKTAMEAHRRQMPRCMGSLIWQLNDCWPAASWSGRDWYGNWKAQQYAVRRAFDDVIISFVEEQGQLNVYIVNDRMTPLKGKLFFNGINLDKNEVYDIDRGFISPKYFDPEKEDGSLTIPANSSQMVMAKYVALDFFNPGKGKTEEVSLLAEALKYVDGRDELVVNAIFKDENGRVYENNYSMAKHKEMKYSVPKIRADIRFEAQGVDGSEGGCELTLTSDVFARGVYIVVDGAEDYFVSDNFFDLMPGESKTVNITFVRPPGDLAGRVSVMSYADARK